MKQKRVLGLFAKWPALGMVKTRLAGDDPAWGVRVAQAFLLDMLQRLAAVDAYRVLVFAPSEREADFATVAGGAFHLTPQAEGDLGRRLAAFVDHYLQAGADAVVMVGTDSPTLPVEHIERAFVELENTDVVIGPATDGGYYLIGCGRDHPPLFENISWSSGRVLAETVKSLDDPLWRLSLLPLWYDVDTPDDWTMLCGHLDALRRAGIDPGVPHTEALIRAVSDAS